MSSLPTPRQILQPPASSQHLTRLRKDLQSLVSQPNGEIALSQLELDEKTGLVVDPLYQLESWEASLVGFVYVLSARLSTALPSLPDQDPSYLSTLWSASAEVCSLVGERWRGGLGGLGAAEAKRVNLLATSFLKLSSYLGWTRQSIRPLHQLLNGWKALIKVSLGEGGKGRVALTGVDGVFLEACVRAREFEQAREVVLTPIEEISASTYGLTSSTYIHQTYFAALIALALNLDALAEEYLLACVSAPAGGGGASAWQVGAGKKLGLVQVLRWGKMQPLPKYTSSTLSKALKPHLSGYRAFGEWVGGLVDAPFGGGGRRGLEDFEGRDGLRKDKNVGLALRVLETVDKRRIDRVKLVYERLSLRELTVLLGEGEEGGAGEEGVKAILIGLVAKGQLQMTLSPSPSSSSPIVHFPPPDAPAPNAQAQARERELVERLEAVNRRAEEVQVWVWEEERRVGLGRKWLAKVHKDSQSAAIRPPAGAGGAGGAAGGLGGMSIDEEDLMEGLAAAVGEGGGGGAGGTGGKRNTYEDDY